MIPTPLRRLGAAIGSPRYRVHGWVCGIAVACAGLLDAHRSDDAVQSVRARAQAALAAAEDARRTMPAAPPPAGALPYLVPADELAQHAQRLISLAVKAGPPLGVELTGASAQVSPGSARRLPRAEVGLAVRGSYPSVKRLLLQALDTERALVLQSLAVDGDAADGIVAAHARVVLLGRPASAAPQGER
ncbi:MAG: hypothetical protein QM750_20565 [Rubrivivax sp.]